MLADQAFVHTGLPGGGDQTEALTCRPQDVVERGDCRVAAGALQLRDSGLTHAEALRQACLAETGFATGFSDQGGSFGHYFHNITY